MRFTLSLVGFLFTQHGSKHASKFGGVLLRLEPPLPAGSGAAGTLPPLLVTAVLFLLSTDEHLTFAHWAGLWIRLGEDRGRHRAGPRGQRGLPGANVENRPPRPSRNQRPGFNAATVCGHRTKTERIPTDRKNSEGPPAVRDVGSPRAAPDGGREAPLLSELGEGFPGQQERTVQPTRSAVALDPVPSALVPTPCCLGLPRGVRLLGALSPAGRGAFPVPRYYKGAGPADRTRVVPGSRWPWHRSWTAGSSASSETRDCDPRGAHSEGGP